MEKSREKKRQQAFMAKMRMRKFRALKKIKRRLQQISNDESMSAMDIDDNSETDSNKRLYGDAYDELEPPCPSLHLQRIEVMEVSQVKINLINS